ncbi:MAG: serine/threonine protein kinase, partial [Betaproteobacteria bacterium]|nr:serine/threonine protein kinase [Betaproteobacteria bacterium]
MGMAETGGEDKARWQQLSGLLDEALALPPEGRAAWLEQLPPQHAELIPSLKRMLAKESQGNDEFLARPVTLPKVLREIGEPADAQGNDIGPYRLIAELGSGGMGTVWIAERSDGSLKRQVALKLPVSQWAPNLIERMRRERDILASLEHPNIARLYDAGMTEEGRPYLALEYVEGKPIDVFCRERRLSVQDRLKLFLQVAKAVSHAHSRLVVHRDLKPNNILVMHNGDVRLLDFGIAKLLSDDEASAGTPTQLTRMAGRALTLDYASPEQIRSERITIASDVYSLGVVLFELLTGQRPYKLKRMSTGAIEDAIVEQDAPTASSVADASTAKVLRGDLDVILAKALKKEVADRYGSVESFATDVSRYLAGLPVFAQPDSTWYRTQKFLRRNFGAVTAVTAVVLALTTGAGIAIWQARVAQVEAARAEEVKRFITSIFRNAETRSGVGGEVLAIDLLSAAATRIDRELSGNPGAAAELGVIVAEGFGFLGKPDMGEKVVRVALEKAEKTYGLHHIISVRAKVQLASIIKHKSPVEAEKMLDEVIAEARTLLPESAEPLVDALSDKGFIASKRNASDVAISSLKESVALSEKYLGTHSKTTIFHLGLLANTQGVFGQDEDQLANAAEALKRAEAALGKNRPD